MESALAAKYEKLREIIRNEGNVAVAFSGGADSSLLLKIAVDVLGDKAVGMLACSQLQPRHELEHAKSMAQEIGCRLISHDIDPLSWPEFTANSPDRCFHCKKKIYTLFLTSARNCAVMSLMDGTNTDDLRDIRPGLRAIEELGVKKPMVEAQLNKTEIRLLSRHLHLRTWNRPSASCLATRVPFDTPINEERLRTVARCEQYLESLDFQGCRVRLNKVGVSLELGSGDIQRFFSDSNRKRVLDYFSTLDIDKVFLDLSERQGIVC